MTNQPDLQLFIPDNDEINIEALIDTALRQSEVLSFAYDDFKKEIVDLKSRLTTGEMRLAVMGQFKRGKSTFVNSLLGVDLLPVSVIPVTSIPTFIRFGKKTICTIRFFDKKPDIVVTESSLAIRETLTKYVSEQNNPKNKFCVREACIECDSSILANGTILIDTPGFGSTFIHNTTTTVELIKSCDAVLFMLSADPPFTQTEVEFLKEVRRFVPQIFFIVNKIDQLTVDELAKLDPFFQSVLTRELGYPPDTMLYHVSARMAQQIDNRNENNPAMEISGLNVVKKEIVDFMVRQKYFTLSQAVGDKFKISLGGIIAKIESEYVECESPLAETQRRRGWLLDHGEQIRQKSEREISLIDVEFKALADHVDNLLETKKKELLEKAMETIRHLIASALRQHANPVVTIKAAFTALTEEMLDNLYIQLSIGIAKPLKRAIELPLAQFEKIRDEVKTAVPSVSFLPNELRELITENKLEKFVLQNGTEMLSVFNSVRLSFFDGLSSQDMRLRRFEEKLLPLATEILIKQFEQLAFLVKQNIRTICDTCKQDLAYNFKLLNDKIDNAVSDLGIMSATTEAPARERLVSLSAQREQFARLRDKLL